MLDFGIAPSEFWNMDPLHFWWLVAARDEAAQAQSGALSDDEKRELLDLMIEGGFTW